VGASRQDLVVVGDHDVHSERVRELDLRVIRGTPVGGEKKLHPLFAEAADEIGIEPVSLLDAVRDVRFDLGAERLEGLGESDRGGDAVGIVVAEDGQALPAREGVLDAVDRPPHPRENVRARDCLDRRLEEPRGRGAGAEPRGVDVKERRMEAAPPVDARRGPGRRGLPAALDAARRSRLRFLHGRLRISPCR
jgi:hypothetical protein